MSDPINIGTIACEDGTLSGAIYDVFAGLVDPSVLSQVETAFQRISFSVASGLRDGIAAAITDGYVVGVESGELVGLDAGGGGGGGAPVDAQYIVATANGDLTAERVATATATVTVDTATPGQIKFNVPDASTTAKGVVELATSAETTAGLAVQASDTRLSDARTPTAHASSHQNGGGDEIDVTGLSGVLADPQTPATHAGSHASGGGDPIKLDDLATPDDNTDLNASTLRHGLLPKLSGLNTNYLRGDGAWSTLPAASTTVSGIVELATSAETTAGLAVQANDTRLSDARTPTAHAASHYHGAGDPLDITQLSGKSGFANEFLNGNLSWVSLPDASTTAKGVVELATSAETTAGLAVQASDTRLSDARTPTAHASSHYSAGGDPLDITQLGGFSGFSSEFLAGDGTWSSVSAGAPTNAEYLTNGSVIGLTAERAVTNTATVTWDWATAGQAKANVPSATTSAEGVVELATDGETTSGVVVQANDGRVRGSSQAVHSVRGSTSRGSSRTLVYRWQTVVDNLGSPDISYSDSSFYGGYWTISNEGIYSVSVSLVLTFTNVIAIKVASGLPTNTFDETSIVVAAQATSAGNYVQASWTGRIESSQRVWITMAAGVNANNANPNFNRCTIVRVR